MKKVLIIDDDALVRMFLRQIIPWEEDGYRIVGDARDGEEGIQMFQKFQPDLVITDVTMPVMNGIDFLKEIKARGFQGGIIMLSCHEDFEYVKTAMALGADEYILKNHLNTDVLHEGLQTVEKHMEKRFHEMNQQDELVAFAQKGMIEIRKEVLQKLLKHNSYTPEEQKELFKTAYISGSFRQCAVVLAHLPAAQNEKKERFYELCQQIAVSNQAEMIVYQERVCAFIVDMTEYPSSRKQYEILAALRKVIHNYTWEYLGIRLSSGTSDICSQSGAIAKAVRQAQQALLLDFYEQGDWSYPEAQKLSKTCPREAEKLIQELPYLIKLGDEVKLVKACEEVIKAFAEGWVIPETVCDWMRRCDLSAGTVRPETEYSQLESIERVKEYTDEYILRLYEMQSARTPDNISISIKNAAEYIKGHFNEGCSLREVADHIGLTPSYLSARFKQEMGIGFIEYLTEVRINQAQWLLKQNPSDTIKSISDQAGFTDYQHFCKVFKKKVGCSPAVFKKKFIKGS